MGGGLERIERESQAAEVRALKYSMLISIN